jgi:opacity protein-like surface antigen
VSARAGLAFDNALVYGKLGVSFGRFEDSFSETDVGTTAMLSGSANYTGVLIGVGFEYALTARWSAKFEFDYINFGTVAVPFTCTGTCTGIGSLTTISTPESEEIAKIGVNYKFW